MLTIGDIGNPACWERGRASPPCWTWRTPAWSDPSAASSAADPASRPALPASPGIFGRKTFVVDLLSSVGDPWHFGANPDPGIRLRIQLRIRLFLQWL